MPSSMASPAASRKRTWWAWRGRSARPQSPRAMAGAAGPERRTMPTPPLPGGVATATMVPVAMRAARAGSVLRGRPGGRRIGVLADQPPLLQQAERAVGDPVQDQAGREEDHEHAEHQRHELHHLLLH